MLVVRIQQRLEREFDVPQHHNEEGQNTSSLNSSQEETRVSEISTTPISSTFVSIGMPSFYAIFDQSLLRVLLKLWENFFVKQGAKIKDSNHILFIGGGAVGIEKAGTFKATYPDKTIVLFDKHTMPLSLEMPLIILLP